MMGMIAWLIGGHCFGDARCERGAILGNGWLGRKAIRGPVARMWRLVGAWRAERR